MKMSDGMNMIQYASKLIELSQFILEYVASERLKMRKFEEGLAIYTCNQQADQPTYTYRELCESAVKV